MLLRKHKKEVGIEQGFKDTITRWGRHIGVPIYVLKLKILGFRGWPDRIIIWPKGQIMFIEFKRKGQGARDLQEFVHGIIRNMGFEVEVFDDELTAVESVKRRVRASASAVARDEINSR